MPVLKTEGGSIFYLDGEDGYPLICLHGLGGSHEQTLSLFSGLEDVRLITLDHRGHGQSIPDDPADISMQVLCDDVLELIDFLRLDHFSLAGISLGAAISLKVAQQQPKGLDKIILVRPAWTDERSPVNLSSLLTIADLIDLHGLEKAQTLWKESEPFRESMKHSVGLATSLSGQFQRDQAERNPIVFRRLIHDRPFPSLSILKSIENPTQVICSADDPLHPLYHGQLIREALPNCTLVELVSKYHHPEVFRNRTRYLVQNFLEDVS